MKPQQLSAELICRGREQALGLDAGLARGVQTDVIDHDVAHDGQVVGGKAGAKARLVLVELHVGASMQAILYLPVATH